MFKSKTEYIPPPKSVSHGHNLSTCTEQQSRIISFEIKGCIFSGGQNHLTKAKTHHWPVSQGAETWVQRKAILSYLK